MRDEGIPAEVKMLLTDYIQSVVQVEALLLLHGSPSREWTAADLARELRIDPTWAPAQLAALCGCGLLSCDQKPELCYRYAPGTPELDAAVQGLARAYSERRVAVISFIFSKPVDRIRGFADAFRLRKNKDTPDG